MANSLNFASIFIVRSTELGLRYRHEVGARNLSIVRKIVLGALGKDKTRKCGRMGKRVVAASDPAFREEVLKNLF